ncbi:MAG TPA: vanadium-dependent haloperoxidase [Chloroflexota bacterium]|nr:vanadium-dependent haloperoxidase [Chloroflexota bacterium]
MKSFTLPLTAIGKWIWLVGAIALLVACQGQGTAVEQPATSPSLLLSVAELSPSPKVDGQTDPPANLVVLWNEVMLAAVRNGLPRPTVTARSLYMVHAAMYDAWALYDDTAVPTVLDPSLKRPAAEHTDAYKGAAVSQAAYHMLIALYPDHEKRTYAFSNLLNALGYKIVMEANAATPAGIGYMAAQAILADRAEDGANAANNFADVTSATYPELYVVWNSADPNAENAPGHTGFNPNHWQPLRVPTGELTNAAGWPTTDHTNPATYRDQVFLTPHWGAVRPFALTSGSQFRPQIPPQAGSNEPYTDALGQTMTHDEAYHVQVDEILHTSATLTDEQKVIAEYWADGPRSETPPGHWNALAHGISFRDKHGIDEDVKLYFVLNGALFDGSIAAWEAKRVYDYIRPASAIQHKYAGQMIEAWGGPNQGTQLIPGETWQPYQSLTFVTPPFAEYVSGHSTFSAAAAEVLTRFIGSNRFYDGVTMLYDEDFNRDGIPDMLGQHVVPIGGNMFEGSPAEVVTLQWATFQEAADEAGISRRYGGIHFQDADLFARRMGTQIGAQAFTLAEQYWTGQVSR